MCRGSGLRRGGLVGVRRVVIEVDCGCGFLAVGDGGCSGCRLGFLLSGGYCVQRPTEAGREVGGRAAAR